MRVLDLFSGIGGFSLGLERAGMQTVAFCEIDPFCRRVLAKHWPGVPVHQDVTQLQGESYAGAVDLVCGGYPCQPFSTAGKRHGAEDERHLWPEMLRIIRGVRPQWVVAENVAGHISLGFDEVATSLEAEGFTVWPFIIPACALGAPHKRERLWIVAHAARRDDRGVCGGIYRQDGRQERQFGSELGCSGEAPGAMADTDGAGLQVAFCPELGCLSEPSGTSAWGEPGRGGSETWRAWEAEPAVGRVVDGISGRVDRLRALGNAVVPQIPEIIGRAIMEMERTKG